MTSNSKNKPRLVCLVLIAIFSFSCIFLTACGKKTEKIVLQICSSDVNAEEIEAFKDAFNASHNGVALKVKKYKSANERDYYFASGTDESDLVTFEHAVNANKNSSSLASLDRNDNSNLYLVSIVNSLRAQDENLYVLPSEGYYYTQGYNLAALSAKGYSIPTTLSDLKLLAARLKSGASSDSPSCASAGGTNSVIFSFMATAYPLFLSTVRGANALSGIATGEISFTDPEYVADWQEIFTTMKALYGDNFYSAADVLKTSEEAMAGFVSGSAYSVQSSGIALEGVNGENPDFVYSAFVGREERSACFCSRPAFYLGVAASAAKDDSKRAAVREVLDFFVSEEGRSSMRVRGNAEEYISYLKADSFSISEKYSALQSKLNEGRLFIVDTFYKLFVPCANEIVTYLNGGMSIDALVHRMEEILKNDRSTAESVIAEIAETLPFDENTSLKGESALGNYLVAALESMNMAEGAIIPSSVLGCSLFKGALTAADLGCVFSDISLTYAEITADDFVNVYNEINKKCYPLTGKVKVNGGKAFKNGGKEYKPNEKMFVLMPSEYLPVISGSYSEGETVKLLDLMLEYFKRN